MRTVRHKKPENFLAAVARNGHGLIEEEALSPREAAHEALVMGLRLAEGIDIAELEGRIGTQLVEQSALSRLTRLGLLNRRGSRLAVAPQGRLLLDSILSEIAA